MCLFKKKKALHLATKYYPNCNRLFVWNTRDVVLRWGVVYLKKILRLGYEGGPKFKSNHLYQNLLVAC